MHRLRSLTDIHTHTGQRPNALLSLPPEEAMAGCYTPFSLALHPWHITEVLITDFETAANSLKDNPHLLAIGECGLDNKCNTPIELQIKAFSVAINWAKTLKLPVIVHCVGCWNELIEMTRTTINEVPFIIHGYRKEVQLAQQLLDAGFDISLGEKFNPEVAAFVPDNRLWFETDESKLDIAIIRQKIVSLRP